MRAAAARNTLTIFRMTTELQSIAASPGVTGLCLHRGATVLEHTFPAFFGDAAAADLCRSVASAFVAYAEAGRPLTQSYFQFPESGMLVLTGSPEGGTQPNPAEDLFLTFLLSDRSAISGILAPARAFLAGQACGM
jgi:hypothetical protein